jgi:hypothetical protein
MYTTSHSASSVASSARAVALGTDAIVDLSGKPVLSAILTLVAMFEMVEDAEEMMMMLLLLLLLLLVAGLEEEEEEEEAAPLYASRIASYAGFFLKSSSHLCTDMD